MSEVRVRALGPQKFAVEVSEGGMRTSHRVRVPEGFLDELGRPEVSEEVLVKESFTFLLEREPATSILASFELPTVSTYFPEFAGELRRRLG